MSKTGYTKEKLYELLPAIYRQRDIQNGKPLEALLEIIAKEVEVLENDIACLYENHFIETCEEWVVPYIGDLVGARILRQVGNTTATSTISHRAWVANTIRYRQGKGTARILEQIARDVTGWNSYVVEFFQILSTTQNLNHLRLQNTRIDVRDLDTLELLDTPFDTIPHTIDVRNITSRRGYHNIPNIGIFLWRLQAYEARNVPAFDLKQGRFTFSQLGYDIPLFNFPNTEATSNSITQSNTTADEEIKVPGLIRRFALYNHLENYYSSRGREKSIKIMVDGKTVSADRIMVCDLEDWVHRPPSGEVALDPERGRISFPLDEIPNEDVHVTYYYGFSGELGGGFYQRPELKLMLLPEVKTYTISKIKLESEAFPLIEDATSQWEVDGKPDAIFRILDSEFYEIPPVLSLPENRTVAILSAQKQRPAIRVKKEDEEEESTLEITGGGDDSCLILDGLLLDLRLRITEKLHDLKIHHCTLVPREEASISYEDEDPLHVSLNRTICGSILMKGSDAEKSESELKITDSIVDGRAANVHENENHDDNNVKHMAIENFRALIENSTIFGEVDVAMLDLASNTIFTDKVKVERRQHGCVRFSYIPDGSLVPRRYRCQPTHGTDPLMADSSSNVYPLFTSEGYGDPGYAQLHRDGAPEIFEGGDNGAEMGAFNHLYQAQRISNLELSLEEYLRFGLEAGILLVDGRRKIA